MVFSGMHLDKKYEPQKTGGGTPYFGLGKPKTAGTDPAEDRGGLS